METKELKPAEISVRLQIMKGKTFRYANQLLTVDPMGTGIDNDKKEFTINTTENGRYRKPFAQAATFFSFWHEVEDKEQVPLPAANGTTVDTPEPVSDGANHQPPANTNTSIAVHDEIQKMDTTADYLITELKDSIAKVKMDAGYVNQAKVVNAAVNSIINVKRTQLEMYKAVSGKK